jgi:hypothetical protein
MGEYFLREQDWPHALPDPHRFLLSRIIGALRGMPEFLGIAAGGSFITGIMDEFSDLDLILVVAPGEASNVERRRHAIAASLGPLLAAFTGEHVGVPDMLICLYCPPPVHVDLKFIVPEHFERRVEDPVVLWDRTGEVRTALTKGRASFPPADWQWIEDRFWVWIHFMSARAGRGELFVALDFLSFLRDTVLGPLALQLAGARPCGVRRLERDAALSAALLESTVPRYDAADIIRAIRATVTAYRHFRKDGAPHDLVRSKAETAAMEFLDDIS